MNSHDVMLIYCPLCRRIVLIVGLEDKLTFDAEKKMDRQSLECDFCKHPIGRIRFYGKRSNTGDRTTMCDVTSLLPKKLFHYTSIETIYKILESKSIRFSRLDYVNDPIEAYTEDFNQQASEYVFTSCWTYYSFESLLNWGRYTSDSGCRLALPTNMFLSKNNSKLFGFESDQIIGETFYDVGLVTLLKDHLYIRIQNDYLKEKGIPEFLANNSIYGPTYVGYGKDESIIKPKLVHNNEFDMLNIGIWKTHYWEDEMEIRFRFYATEAHYDHLTLNEWESTTSPFRSYKRVLDTYIDVPLKPEALNDAEILFAPLANEKSINELKKYCQEYFPMIKLSHSLINMKITHSST